MAACAAAASCLLALLPVFLFEAALWNEARQLLLYRQTLGGRRQSTVVVHDKDTRERKMRMMTADCEQASSSPPFIREVVALLRSSASLLRVGSPLLSSFSRSGSIAVAAAPKKETAELPPLPAVDFCMEALDSERRRGLMLNAQLDDRRPSRYRSIRPPRAAGSSSPDSPATLNTTTRQNGPASLPIIATI